jgi:hypothetical protein
MCDGALCGYVRMYVGGAEYEWGQGKQQAAKFYKQQSYEGSEVHSTVGGIVGKGGSTP